MCIVLIILAVCLVLIYIYMKDHVWYGSVFIHEYWLSLVLLEKIKNETGIFKTRMIQRIWIDITKWVKREWIQISNRDLLGTLLRRLSTIRWTIWAILLMLVNLILIHTLLSSQWLCTKKIYRWRYELCMGSKIIDLFSLRMNWLTPAQPGQWMLQSNALIPSLKYKFVICFLFFFFFEISIYSRYELAFPVWNTSAKTSISGFTECLMALLSHTSLSPRKKLTLQWKECNSELMCKGFIGLIMNASPRKRDLMGYVVAYWRSICVLHL